MTIFEKKRIIQGAIDRIWSSEDPEQIEFRNKLFPKGKPGVLKFVIRLRGEVMLRVLHRKVCKLLLFLLFFEKPSSHQDKEL